jgi:hypothetical protein
MYPALNVIRKFTTLLAFTKFYKHLVTTTNKWGLQRMIGALEFQVQANYTENSMTGMK